MIKIKTILLLLTTFIFSQRVFSKIKNTFDLYAFKKIAVFSVEPMGVGVIVTAANIIQNPSKGNLTIDTNFIVYYTANNYKTTDLAKVAVQFYYWGDTTKTSYSDTFTYNLYSLSSANTYAYFTHQPDFYSTQFYDASSSDSTILGRKWDFGDGITSAAVNPVHNYISAGIKTVCLEVYTNVDTSKYCMDIQVWDSSYIKAQQDYFVYYYPDSSNVFDPLKNDKFIGSAVLGLVDTGKDIHVAIVNNKLEVSVKNFNSYIYENIRYSICKGTTCDTGYTLVTVSRSPSFGWCNPEIKITNADKRKITFDWNANCAGKNKIKSFEWSFGNGKTSSLSNPTHTFANYGNYVITFNTTDSLGFKQTAYYYLDLFDSRCFTDWSYNAGIQDVDFKAVSQCFDSTNNFTYNWNFGDGNGATGQIVSHTYASAGIYKVCLNRIDGNDTLEICKEIEVYDTNTIIARDDYANLSAILKTLNINILENDIVSNKTSFTILKSTANGTISNLGNGKLEYTRNGGFLIGVDSLLYSICKGSKCDTANLIIKVYPEFDTSSCTVQITATGTGLTRNFSSSYSCINNTRVPAYYYWFLGDDDTSMSATPGHTYAGPGNYLVYLYIIDTNGYYNYGYQYVSIKDTSINGGCVKANDDQFLTNYYLLYNSYNVVLNDINVDFNEVKTTKLKDFSNGTGLLNSKGAISYLPNSNFNGCDTLFYEVMDTVNNCRDTASVIFCVEDLGISCIDTTRKDTSGFCDSTYAPVCGCNQEEYRNYCVAYFQEGVNFFTQGPCGNRPPITSYNGVVGGVINYTIYAGEESIMSYNLTDPDKNTTRIEFMKDANSGLAYCFDFDINENNQTIICKPKSNCIGDMRIMVLACDQWGSCKMDTINFTIVNRGTNRIQANEKISMSVFPNPGQEELNVRTNSALTNGKVILYSLEGKELLNVPCTGITTKLKTSNLNSGVYIVKLVSSNGANSATQRWVKM